MMAPERLEAQTENFIASMDTSLPIEWNLKNAFLDKSYYKWPRREFDNLCQKIQEAYDKKELGKKIC